jgi:2,4-dienoyl-CoA reductase (NADPH2)
MTENDILFSPFLLNGLGIKNRLIMAPTFLNYADQNGQVTDLLLDHYAEMASSGVAMVVVEKTAVHLVWKDHLF